ncbi:MAG: hypothetical protein LBU26_05890 [Synergistaceae bacterium]|jgi:hypothetical protein|nr:hypothetical protein [Synergistaceae bacterium]
MKRILAAIFALSLFLVLPALATARGEYFNFSLDLDDGWTAGRVDSTPEMEDYRFMPAGETSEFAVTVKRTSALSSHEFARKLSEQTGGTEPIDNGDGLYRFVAASDAAKANILVGMIEGRSIMIVIAGADPGLKTAAGSFRVKLPFKPKTDALF